MKFIYKSAPYEWVDCRDPDYNLTGKVKYDNYMFHEQIIKPSLFHGLWDGCQVKIYFDDTIEDIILHDAGNSTYRSVKKNFNEELFNPTYV